MLYNLEDIKRIHGSRTVLNIAKLEIRPNQVYTLVGPNGAGKTSLLKILAFLDRPSSGHLFFRGRQVLYRNKHMYQLRRRVVLLDQSPIMFTGSVWKNVEFGLRVRKVVRQERKQRVEEALELVGMERFSHYNAHGLSGGETKRVALARALVLQPEVLLCDEPTANVDNENQEIILEILTKINKEQNSSIIFSTHYLSQAHRLADHTLLLQQGSLSDIASENIYRTSVVDHKKTSLVCQLTGQLFLSLPKNIFPDDVNTGKLHIDPNCILLNPATANAEDGNTLNGHIIELSQSSGRVKITIDVGVKMNLVLAMEEYRLDKPAIGDKSKIFIPHTCINFTSVDLG